MTQEDDGREDQLSNLADLLADLHDGTQAAMQLGGHPSMDCIEWQVESGWLEPGDWTVLLEVGSVGTMMWSDAGFLEFLVRREDRTCGYHFVVRTLI